MNKKKFIVSITGAAGNIGSSLCFLIAKENIFGQNIELTLRMVDLPERMSYLKGIKLELEDCIFQNLKFIEIH